MADPTPAAGKTSWDCPSCGRKNQLFQFRCLDCGQRFTDEVAKSQGIMPVAERLPEYARKEIEHARSGEELRAERHVQRLKSRKLLDAAKGLVLFLVLFFPLALLTPFYLLFAPFAGGAAGLLLNRAGGGNLEGMSIYAGFFLTCLVAGLIVGGFNPVNFLFFLFGVAGLALSTTVGYLSGMMMSLQKFDEGF